MSADTQIHTHTHIRQLMSYELVYTSIHSSIIIYYINIIHSRMIGIDNVIVMYVIVLCWNSKLMSAMTVTQASRGR